MFDEYEYCDERPDLISSEEDWGVLTGFGEG